MKPLFFVGSTRDDLADFPGEVRRSTGYALYLAQLGEKHPHAKPLKGFGGAGVLEVVEQYDGDAFRTIYTVRLEHAVYVLHAFQKKSPHGISTSARDMERVRVRLRRAEAHHEASFKQSGEDR